MKNWLCFVFLLIPTIIFSQLKIEHRIVAGVNYSNVLIHHYNEQSYIINGGKSGPFFKLGVHLGYQVNSKIYKKFGVQTGLLYNQKGARHYFDNPKLRIDYISIPCLIRFKPVTKPFIVRAGFAWEFAVNANDQLIPVSRIQPLLDKTVVLGFEYTFFKNWGISLNLYETINFYNSSKIGKNIFGDKNQLYQLSFFKTFES